MYEDFKIKAPLTTGHTENSSTYKMVTRDHPGVATAAAGSNTYVIPRSAHLLVLSQKITQHTRRLLSQNRSSTKITKTFSALVNKKKRVKNEKRYTVQSWTVYTRKSEREYTQAAVRCLRERRQRRK